LLSNRSTKLVLIYDGVSWYVGTMIILQMAAKKPFLRVYFQSIGSSGQCPIKNWCVCQWAFARYIQLSGGCDFIQTIKCDAIHESVISTYQSKREYQYALDCLVQRCNIQLYSNEM